MQSTYPWMQTKDHQALSFQRLCIVRPQDQTISIVFSHNQFDTDMSRPVYFIVLLLFVAAGMTLSIDPPVSDDKPDQSE